MTDVGVLRSYAYTAEIELDGGSQYTVSVAGEFVGIGSTDVDEPAWLPEARTATA